MAAVLFALEEIIGDMNASLLGSTVVASVAAVIVERSILGNEPLFHVPTYRLVHPAELIAYAALGILGGVVSLLFCKGLLVLRGLFLRLPPRTKVFQPAIGGLVIGAILVYSPAIMGVGYEYVDQALNGGLVLKTMAILCFLKLGATIVSYASGNAGGIFAPSLYIGASREHVRSDPGKHRLQHEDQRGARGCRVSLRPSLESKGQGRGQQPGDDDGCPHARVQRMWGVSMP